MIVVHLEPSECRETGECGAVRVNECHLDLRRAEVRDRLARVVHPHTRYGVAIPIEGRRLYVNADSSSAWYEAHDLDPTDDTRLPDGSRLVEALALVAVAREVLGG